MIRAFCLALVFLTRLPIPVWFEPTPRDWGRSVFFFPFVGLMIGMALAGVCAALSGSDAQVLTVLTLCAWTLITGGLHLDGLADTADAWIGGQGDAAKTLAIMKDPRSGPIAIMAVTLLLLVKFAAIGVLVEQSAWGELIWVPILGRAAMVLLMMITPYARPEGIGAVYSRHLPRRDCTVLLLAIPALLLLTLGWRGLVLTGLLALGMSGWRRVLLGRVGGVTGDTLGATCELTEAISLLVLVLIR